MKILARVAMFLIVSSACALPAAAMHHAVKVAEKPGLGFYLTDAGGMTLYMFKKDSPGMSACSGGCIDNWPIYYQEHVAPPEGVMGEDFATITRGDGAMQTTFRGYPLYYFKGDASPGDTKGEGIKEVWYVIDPNNFPHQ